MIFVINKLELAAYDINDIQNPKNPSNPMVMGLYRTQSKTALFTVHSKKAFAEFWDNTERKKIARRLWTPEMKAFASQKIAQAPKPASIFKLTIVGWLFVALVVTAFGLIAYQAVKPPVPKSAESVAMEQKPVVGDLYFGRFEAFKEPSDHIASGMGFGWFKVIDVDGDVYHIAKSTDMSITHKPKEALNSTDFESEGTPVKITEQASYLITMKSVDGKMEISITDKQ
ncbi:hypothetical protein [Sphingobacterium corticibacter]|uniref:Uncharacterized protein n=1 Tax=Sphingobacterium corticibacter TaxID=2171749 RepID=A0A2T8HER3_9SPHI|nr:hypothetical protein [Sphingobacterium corticibacter]PVH23905.1 hypothetical protein DC487_16885 [Sphingobacterium corticibacter]